ncbi:sensor histidine kinase [Nonomuraea dietziae]|uniref:sensor histidine kinase n=1 Tax=Nonomuraea dietziae TaxID=65515 RepID=UPI0033C83629
MALLCAGICALILIVGHERAVDDRIDKLLHDATLRMAHLIEADRLSPVIRDEHVTAIQVVDPSGRIVAANEPMIGKPRLASFAPQQDNSQLHQIVCDSPSFPDACMIIVAMRISVRGGQWIIYGADPVVPWYISRSLLAALLGGSTLLVGATAIGAYRTVSKTLDPVDAISAELAEITSTDLGRRVPEPRHRDEIQKLAQIANRTLDRLQAAVERERRFASDASHDLRSPITAMRTQVEEALLHPGEADWPAMAQAQLAGLERLQAIVTDLLALCRLDAGAGGATDLVDLSELVGSELARRVHQRNIVTRLHPGAVVTGDRLQLIRLLTNLMDNAERHATSTVTVAVGRESGHVALHVSDDGHGIPVEQREFIFQRFARLDAARNKDTGGTGLGLAIARQIAEHHGGTLTIEDSEQGARFVARIPASPRRGSGETLADEDVGS